MRAAVSQSTICSACQVANIPLDEMSGKLIPLVGTTAACLALITFVPQISLFLRDLLY